MISALARGSNGGLVSAMRIRERSHLGNTEAALGLSLLKERRRAEMAESWVMSLMPVCLKAEDMADLYPVIVEGARFLSWNKKERNSAS